MASKTLVVVESPAKAKTINRYLGRNYMVEASVGHIKDLAKTKLGVDIENDFKPKYTTIKGKGDIVKKLKEKAAKAGQVLIATDPDREGEAIAWHLAEEIKKKNDNVKRVLFNEITKDGIKKGIEEPSEINENLYMSQQARRVMDRLIGFKVSPFLSRAMLEKTAKALSAGRVQSVALRLICEREHQIDVFEPIEYWNITADFKDDDAHKLSARLVAFDKKNIKNPEGSGRDEDPKKDKVLKEELKKQHFIKNEEQAAKLLSEILKQQYRVSDISKKEVLRRPQPPFTTSLLQQEASKRLGFSNKKTMRVAQTLYEGLTMGKDGQVGLITYMRTDSVRLSPEAQKSAISFIKKNYGDAFLPDTPNVYTTKSAQAQEAHEAIRPTSLEYTPADVQKHAGRDEALLYELIFNRFMASQMAPAIINQTSISIKGGDYEFRATGSVIKFKGFLAAYDDPQDEKLKPSAGSSQILPDLKKSQDLDLAKADKSQSFTKAPPRFTESSIVKELDELGIGRPSTYAQIISTLLDREYVNLVSKAFVPTEIGIDVFKILIKNFPGLFNVDFTAGMEKELDIVAEGKKTYLDMLKEFYAPFIKSLKHAEEKGEFPVYPCPECGAPMDLKVGRMGRFLGCSRYPDCKGTSPLPKIQEKMEEKKEPEIAEGVECPECGKPMAIRDSRFGRFLGCVDYPNCKGTLPISTGVTCPKCKQGELVEKYSPKSRKNFWGCSRYPDCDQISNYQPIDEECPECGHYYLEKRFRKADGGWEPYKRCPECKSKFDMEGEKAEEE